MAGQETRPDPRHTSFAVFVSARRKKRLGMDGWTDRPTDGLTDGPIDVRTQPLI